MFYVITQKFNYLSSDEEQALFTCESTGTSSEVVCEEPSEVLYEELAALKVCI